MCFSMKKKCLEKEYKKRIIFMSNLKDLVKLSRELGKPENKFTILGEGNTSCRHDNRTFFVKASGSCLADMKEDQFVQVDFKKILTLLDMDNPGNTVIGEVYKDSKVNSSDPLKPSVEALFHAVCLSYTGVNFVGHTHPVAINKLTCSRNYPEILQGRMYPDEVVVLSYDSVFIPYVDPGVSLAKYLKKEIDSYIKKYNECPKAVYVQNHGFIALGTTAKEVLNITLTADKAAEIRYGAFLAGGIRLLKQEDVYGILERPDEKYRKEKLIKGE
jgi:rhamnose utilization protein RhaD (predicted bifunctional aldolase and dehydrogenase)